MSLRKSTKEKSQLSMLSFRMDQIPQASTKGEPEWCIIKMWRIFSDSKGSKFSLQLKISQRYCWRRILLDILNKHCQLAATTVVWSWYESCDTFKCDSFFTELGIFICTLILISESIKSSLPKAGFLYICIWKALLNMGRVNVVNDCLIPSLLIHTSNYPNALNISVTI